MALSKVDLANQVENQLPQSLVADNVNFRNIIINGDMSIAQRGTSTASITSAGYYTVDRFRLAMSSAGTWTSSQDTDVPSGQGFANSLKLDCTTADASLAASDYVQYNQFVEGQNLQYLKWGTASAESLTLSFWVKSNKTGTYIAELRNSDNTRTRSLSYTISASNTWEKKTITFGGDTNSGPNNDNGEGLRLTLWLAAGSDFTSGTLATDWETTTQANRAVGQVNLADDTANNFWITGVQLEAGTSASDFEFLPHDINKRRCERYYQNSFNIGNVPGTSTSQDDSVITTGWTDGNAPFPNPFRTEMRSAPTVTLRPRGSTTTGQVNNGGTNRNATATNISNKNVSYLTVTSGTGGQYNAYSYELSSEL